MEIIGVKVLAGFLFFFLAMLFGWIPFWCLRRRCGLNGTGGRGKKSVLLPLLHAMASGVLLATCMLSLMPEALETVRVALQGRREIHHAKAVGGQLRDVNSTGVVDSSLRLNSGDDAGIDNDYYPVGELLIVLGFITIYILDSCMKTVQLAWESKNRSLDDSDDQFVTYQQSSDIRTCETPGMDGNESSRLQVRNTCVDDVTLSGSNMSKSQASITPPSTKRSRWTKHTFSRNPECEVMETSFFKEDKILLESKRLTENGDDSDQGRRDMSIEQHPLAEHPGRRGAGHDKTAQLRSVALVAALCVHAFFDGVMLGLQTSISVLLSLLFALSVHKSFVALSLSLTLLNNQEKGVKASRALLFVTLFAAVAPLGLATSSLLVHRTLGVKDSTEASVIPGCLQAFAVGTFMFVAFTETVGHHRRRSCKAEVAIHVSLLIGVAIMGGLRSAVGDV